MLYGAKALSRYAIRTATDVLGGVADVYFDDELWRVRHLVIALGTSAVDSRLVVVNPASASRIDHEDRLLAMRLTTEELQSSPSASAARPEPVRLSAGLLKAPAVPPFWPPPIENQAQRRSQQAAVETRGSAGAPSLRGASGMRREPHLQSARDLAGSVLGAWDGDAGRLSDVMIVDGGWEIRYLCVSLGEPSEGRCALVPASRVVSIDPEEKRIRVDLNRTQIEKSPSCAPSRPVGDALENAVSAHYERRH
jgi:hypothetical protein